MFSLPILVTLLVMCFSNPYKALWLDGSFINTIGIFGYLMATIPAADFVSKT